jgi:hypothetical protein
VDKYYERKQLIEELQMAEVEFYNGGKKGLRQFEKDLDNELKQDLKRSELNERKKREEQ